MSFVAKLQRALARAVDGQDPEESISEKEGLGLGSGEALTYADDDIDEHWEGYLATFLRRFGG